MARCMVGRFRRAVWAIALVWMVCSACQAATLVLSASSPASLSWQVFGSLNTNADNDGLASLIVDVTAWGSLTIGSSLCRLPAGTHYWLDGGVQSELVGFTEYRSNGVAGNGVRAGQRTVAADQVVLEDVGYLAGSYPGDQTGQGLGPLSIDWSAPVLIASGTFTGQWGRISVNVGDGQVNVLDQDRPPGATGQVHRIESVLDGFWDLLHAGDANGDWAANVGDLGVLAAHWGQSGGWSDGDFSGDGNVNVGDLGILAGNWGWSTVPPPGQWLLAAEPIAAPAPPAIAVMALGGWALLPRRRRTCHQLP